MESKLNIRINICLIFLLLLFSCSNKKERKSIVSEREYLELLKEVYLQIFEDNSKRYLLYTPIESKLPTVSIDYYIDNFSYKVYLATKLRKNFNHKNFKSKFYEGSDISFIIDNELQMKMLNDNKEEVAGLFEASKIVYSKDEAVFYFALQLGELGGKTYLVFLNYHSEKWEISKVKQCLEGSGEPIYK